VVQLAVDKRHYKVCFSERTLFAIEFFWFNESALLSGTYY